MIEKLMLSCWNCKKRVPSEELVDASYCGYDLFVCLECKELLEKNKKDGPKSLSD